MQARVVCNTTLPDPPATANTLAAAEVLFKMQMGDEEVKPGETVAGVSTKIEWKAVDRAAKKLPKPDRADVRELTQWLRGIDKVRLGPTEV